jgi:hypothetical protein
MKNEKLKKKIIFLILVFLIVLGLILFFVLSGKKTSKIEETPEIVREPAVAEQFYPGDKEELSSMIDNFLANATLPGIKGEPIAFVVPHAGYQFSGQVAAYGYKALEGEQVDTVIIIGNSHYERFDGISVFLKGVYKTPLGEVKINSDLAQKIIQESKRIFFKESAHKLEHSIEVQIPFLQKVLKHFKIVPIIFGNSNKDDWKILGDALLKNIKGENVILIASSDLSHYPPYEVAKYADKKIIEAILTGDIEHLEKTVEELQQENLPNTITFACGIDAIKTVMYVAKHLGADEIKLLKYVNSGNTAGDKNRVVGYSAIGFFAKRRDNLLNKEERDRLLQIARASVESFIREGKILEFQEDNPMLNQKLGAFVTIKKHGKLRGCIGEFSPAKEPLYKVVSKMAIAAATKDIRFLPVREEELDELEYEVSVLSEPQKIDDWKKIELGKHGVIIRQGLAQGVFLPQVADETGWSLEKFLSELCSQKAHLPPNCYKDKDTEIYIFTAQVFWERWNLSKKAGQPPPF